MTPLSRIVHLNDIPPPNTPVVLLIRHAERPEIPANKTGNELKLTGVGQEASISLGRMFGQNIASINTSPIPRCIETASLIKDASNSNVVIAQSVVLGDPGAYVYDEALAWDYWFKHGSERVLGELMSNKKTPPGLHSVEHGTRVLLKYFKQFLMGASGYHVCISHDVVLLPFVAHLSGMPIDELAWPNFLQAASLHCEHDKIILRYQNFASAIQVPT